MRYSRTQPTATSARRHDWAILRVSHSYTSMPGATSDCAGYRLVRVGRVSCTGIVTGIVPAHHWTGKPQDPGHDALYLVRANMVREEIALLWGHEFDSLDDARNVLRVFRQK